MSTIFTVPRLLIAVLVAASLGGSSNAGSAAARYTETTKPIVTVLQHGGYCLQGECRTLFRITDMKITAPGYLPRRLKPTERAALLRAIRSLDPGYFRTHPFTGMCPTASDGQESIYRFRGYNRALASCTYDLRAVKAVQLTDRLLASLRPRS